MNLKGLIAFALSPARWLQFTEVSKEILPAVSQSWDDEMVPKIHISGT